MLRIIYKFYCIILIIFLVANLQASKNSHFFESIAIGEDSIQICFDLYLKQAKEFKNSDSIKSSQYYKKALIIINNTKVDSCALKFNYLIARHDFSLSNYQNIPNYLNKSLAIALKTNNKEWQIKLYHFFGLVSLNAKGNYREALDYYLKAFKLANQTNNKKMIAKINSSFGVIYHQQNKLDSAYSYYKSSQNYYEQQKDTEAIMAGGNNLGGVLMDLKKYEEARHYLFQTILLVRSFKNQKTEIRALFNIANSYEREGKLTQALLYTEECIKKAENYHFDTELLKAKSLLATIRFKEKKYNESINIVKAILASDNKDKVPTFIPDLYSIIIACYEETNDFKNAFYYQKKAISFSDSITKEESLNYLEELKSKYNVEKKDEELRFKNELLIESKKTEKQKNITIIALCVSLISIVSFSLIYFNQRKSKQEGIQKEKEYTTQLQNFESFINGQETERTRIASDLHDGLAQNLVMLNLELSSLKNNNATERIVFLQNEVNKMINETRKIAHNMMPDVLVDLGLPKALKSLIAKLNENSTDIKFTLTITEPFTNIDKNTEVQLYRMTQELLNNSIKHSGATKCDVILESSSYKIKLVVKDNGKGMDMNDESENGIGLKNLYTRTHSLKGQLTIQTPQNKGVLISIDIPTKNTQNG